VKDPEDLTSHPDEGVYIYGMICDAFRFDFGSVLMADSYKGVM